MTNGNGNWNGNGGWPLSKKKTVRLLIALTILCWATQTLLSQWGFGQAVSEPNTSEQAEHEKFVPGTARFASGATLELRSEATVVGAEVKLKQVCRWSDSDAAIFAPVADLTLMRLGPKVPFRSISVEDLKSTLRDAGVNLAAINVVGAMSCTVGRSDVKFNEADALQKWIDAHDGKVGPTTEPSDEADVDSDRVAATAQPSASVAAPSTQPTLTDSKEYHTLRDLLVHDLSTRLNIPQDRLQITFRPQDDRLLSLCEPHFKFQIDGKRARDVGDVTWSVTLVAEHMAAEPGSPRNTQTALVSATARAWQTQLVVARPLSAKQVIREEDVIERRALVDQLGSDPVIEKPAAIGQQAARDLKPGTVLTARMVDALQLVRPGQLVTVMLRQGGVQVKTVARALEGGSMGQTIRVKNETTRDIFTVVLTGPQTASMTGEPTAPTGVVSARN